MNRATLLLPALILLASCRKPEAASETPTKETAAGVAMIDYDPPKGAFTCRAPGAWKIQEDDRADKDGVTFIGPPSEKGGMPFITILQYPNKTDRWSDAQKYAESFWESDPAGKQPVLEKKRLGENDAIVFHQERPFRKLHSTHLEYMVRYDYALIPAKSGFFELWHSAPVSAYQETLPVFEAVVRSFKPK